MLYMVEFWDGEQEQAEVMNEVQLDTAKHDWAIVIDRVTPINHNN